MSDNPSIFNNLPSNPDEIKKIEEEQNKKLINDLEKSKSKKLIEKQPELIYQIMFGDDNENTEYYTFQTPILKEYSIIVMDVIQKGILKEDVINTSVEIAYKIQLPSELSTISKNLEVGVLIKVLTIDKLPWLNSSFNQAKEELKEETIKVYKTLLPKLVNQVQTLQNQIKKKNNNKLDF